jgi:riboflavin kinase/FMN adenylyltransferase
VLTIGNFDGVHLGHREIFRQVVRQARSVDGTSAVLTFEPHPLRLLAPEKAPPRINTPEEKVRLIEASCIDLMVVLPFTRELAALSAGEFVREILVERLGVRHLVVGYDYAFGRDREGNIDFLQDQADHYGFQLHVLEPICTDEQVYSSTRIRKAVRAGEVAAVVRMLGRNFTLDGQVVHGAGRGRQLGFPTSNLETIKELLPKEGVYAVKVKWHERLYDAVVNIGHRPTFDDLGPALEIHLLDFDGDLYDETLRLYFVERLREEKRFESIAELQDAVRADIRKARNVLAEAQLVVYREYLDCGHE